MSRIEVSNLTFGYEGSYDNIFENVSFSVDTDWKLGLIGRNGKGKTTLLRLLLGKYSYLGSIRCSVCFDYFPFQLTEEQKAKNTIDIVEKLCPEYELWKLCRELEMIKTDSELLYRPFVTLSFGEQTKVMLALLFSKEGNFLLIDEPTNHLDMPTREVVKEYLNAKKGFILVSHDRNLLDACIDHVLVLNRSSIEVQKGNFSSWWENKQRQDAYELSENEKLKSEIGRLKEAERRTSEWAQKNESKKIGFNPIKEHDRCISTRAYIGAKTKKMQKRSKSLEVRQISAIEEKSELLKNLEEKIELKMMPQEHYKDNYIRYNKVSLGYGDKEVLSDFSMTLDKGDRLVLRGKNGCGKSSVVKSILANQGVELLNKTKEDAPPETLKADGELWVAKGLKVSYINQDTTHLKGSLNEYIEKLGLEESLFKALLRQLDFERVQFEKSMDEYSEGQRKKVLIVSSLLQQAHLYIWDEPLNYIDVFSRIQIEDLILRFQPTMLLIEHDISFCEKISTKEIDMK